MKSLKTITVFFVCLLGAFLCSCQSTSQEKDFPSKSTFVNTKPLSNGKIYSIIVFSKLTSVEAHYEKNSTSFSIPLENCKYDPDSTLLEVTLPDGISQKGISFTIVGEPVFPAEFILVDAVYRNVNPGIFYNGKKASEGIDYKLDSKTNHLTFITPLDADKGSYNLIWLSRGGTNSLSNNTDKYKSQYDLLERQWYKSIGNSR